MTNIILEVFTIKHIVYYDYGGSHTSVTAAAVHTGRLPSDKLPSGDDLMAVPYLDKTTPEDFGKLKHIGTDKNGDQIYALGTKISRHLELLGDMAGLLDVSNQYVFLNTSPYVNNVLRVGGWLSRSVSLPALGRPLVVSGLRDAFPALSSMVERVKLQQKGSTQ